MNKEIFTYIYIFSWFLCEKGECFLTCFLLFDEDKDETFENYKNIG